MSKRRLVAPTAVVCALLFAPPVAQTLGEQSGTIEALSAESLGQVSADTTIGPTGAGGRENDTSQLVDDDDRGTGPRLLGTHDRASTEVAVGAPVVTQETGPVELVHSGLHRHEVLMLLGNDTDAIMIGAERLPTDLELRAGDALPDGAPVVRVPIRLLARLPYFEGYEWARAGRNLLLYHRESRVVAEVIPSVFQ